MNIIEHYHMIVVAILTSLLLGLGVLFFYFIYPKRKINLFVFLILIAILPLLSIARSGTYQSGVLSENVYITKSFYQTLTDGNLVPVWNAAGYAGYGVPQHIFQYPLPYYIASFYHFLSLPYLASVKLELATAFLISGITMYVWIKNKYGIVPAFVASLFYLFAPYHLIEMHFRATVGTTLAFAFIPLILLTIDKTNKKTKLISVFGGAISFMLLIIADIQIAFITLPLFFLYILYPYIGKAFDLKKIIWNLLIFFLGICLSAFYLLPAFYDTRYSNNLTNFAQTGDFKPLLSYFYAPAELGFLFQGHHGETYFIIGYAHVLMVLIISIILIRNKINKNDKKITILFIVLFSLYLLMTQSITKPVWQLPLFRDVYDSWKVLLPITVITSFFAAVVTYNLQKNSWAKNVFTHLLNKNRSFKLKKNAIKNSNIILIGIISFFVVFSTILNWGNRMTVPINYEQLDKNWNSIPPPNTVKLLWTTWVNKYSTWVNTSPKSPIEVEKGHAIISQIKRTTTTHEYIIYADSNVMLKENTMYFPGWIVKVNNAIYPFSYTTNPNAGLITINLKKGLYKVDVYMTNTPVQQFANMLSIATFLFLSMLSIRRKLLYVTKYNS